MKKNILFIFALLIAATSCTTEPQPDRNRVNPLLGDLSSRLGQGLLSPDHQTEQQRVAAHLAFAEHVLRNRETPHLSPEMRQNRLHLLDLLHTYRQAGVFPANCEHPGERRPCFIDRRGNICAVGYLVEQTAGRQAAEGINSLFQYADIADMDHAALDEWIAGSGLSRDEVAMIQPTYGPTPNTNRIDSRTAVASALSGGIATGSSILSLTNMNNPNFSKAWPAVGLSAGMVQAVVGFVPLAGRQRFSVASNSRVQTLAMLNLGLGTTHMLVNGYALLRKRPVRPKAPQIGFFGAPTAEGERMAWGVGLSKRF